MKLRIGIVLALALSLALVPAAAAPASPEPSGAVAKKKRCKKGKVRMKVGKRTRCVKLGKAFPKPKAIDVRKSAGAFVIGANFSKLRDRNGRRLPSLPKLLRQVDPKAESALQGALKAGLARMDAIASTARATGCTSSPGAIQGSYTSGGVTVDLTLTAQSLGMSMESLNGQRRVRMELEMPACGDGNAARVDDCPTADGIVRGSDNRHMTVRVTVTEGSTVVWSQGIALRGETTHKGFVEDTAKLRRLDVHNQEDSTLMLGGSSRGFAPLTIRTILQRLATVEMPSGTFNPAPSILAVEVSSSGISGSERREVEQQISGQARQQADRQFRDIVNDAITKYRERERGWNEPNRCATLTFTPASNTRRLRLGDSGTFTAAVQAKPGGSPSNATWTRVGAENATVTPGSASGGRPSFRYSGVQHVGAGIFVRATLKAVSKAGVARQAWTQPTLSDSINNITGSFSGVWNFGGSVLSWSGGATWLRAAPGSNANGQFALKTGSYTVTASGKDGTGGTDCTQTGTKAVTLTTNGFASVQGQPPAFTPPYTYSASAAAIGPSSSNMQVTLSGCSDQSYNGKVVTIGLPFSALETGSQTSADGITYTGHHTDIAGVTSWNWNLHGTP
ncbi:MAG TPA: hypothetical protein VFX51_27485 [Solirubrobacteraceae bacterium]|nr:hypothetical protein [Solirubrobacteraceae bacterium]